MELSKEERGALGAFSRLSESKKQQILTAMDFILSLPPAQPAHQSSFLSPADLRHQAHDTS